MCPNCKKYKQSSVFLKRQVILPNGNRANWLCKGCHKALRARKEI